MSRFVEFAAPAGIAAVGMLWSAWAVGAAGGDLEAAWMGGTVVPALLDAGAHWWRLLCAGWLHTDAAHAISNLAGLVLPAMALARVARPRTVYPVWALGAVVGCLASWALTRTWAHGASAGNAALAAAVAWVGVRRWGALDGMTRRWALVGSLPWLVLLMVPRTEPVDHWAHLGGALTGPLGAALGARAAVAFALAHTTAFGLMIHAASQPPWAGARVEADGWETFCAGPLVSDGLVAVCRAHPGMQDERLPVPVTDSHLLWVVKGHAVFAPPGHRAQRVLDDDPGRFFDGSTNPR